MQVAAKYMPVGSLIIGQSCVCQLSLFTSTAKGLAVAGKTTSLPPRPSISLLDAGATLTRLADARVLGFISSTNLDSQC
jgi:hypothetical protein